MFDGRFKLIDMKNWSAGIIDKGSQIGAYIESSLKGIGNFFMNISLDIKFDLNNYNTPHDGYAITPEYATYLVVAVIVFILSLSSSVGSLVFA